MNKTRILFLIIGFIGLKMFSQDLLVADLKVQGNKKLKTGFVKKMAYLKSGSVLDSAVMDLDIKRLKQLPSVSHAYYQVFPAENNTYNIFYNIIENFTIIPSISAYTTNDEEFAYRIGLYEYNFFGQNIAFGGFYQKDIFNSYALNFRAPYLFSNKFGLAWNLQNLTTLEPVFFDNTAADYRYNNESFEILSLYEINFHNRLEMGFNYFTEDYQYKYGATSPNIPQDLIAKKNLYKLIYEYNNLDYFYQYISGFRSTLNLQHVRSRNNNALPNFWIGWNDFRLFKRVGEKGNWANRIRFGLSSNDDTPFAPFSVDNNVNIRGVGNTIDRGTGVIVLNTEYRYSLYEDNWFVIQGNAFVDSGTWRNPGGETSDFVKAENIKIYPGLGLRFIHKKIFNAIFRIDYGYGISKDASEGLVFGIGQYF